jgi:hypothetical protein
MSVGIRNEFVTPTDLSKTRSAMLSQRMSSGSNRGAASRRGKNVPCLDGKALALLILVISLVVAAVWFGHARLETNNNPSLQGFGPKSTPNH